MSSEDRQFRLIIEKPGLTAYNNVQASLAALFGISDNLAKKILNAAPVAILSGLSAAQAAGLTVAFSPLAKAGGFYRIENNLDQRIGHIKWPNSPTIAGRLLQEYEQPAGDDWLGCPACGARLTLGVYREASQAQSGQVKPTGTRIRPAVPAEGYAANHDDTVSGTARVSGRRQRPTALPGQRSAPDKDKPMLKPRAEQETGLLSELNDDPLFQFDSVENLIDTQSVAIIGSEDIKEFETSLMKAVGAKRPTVPKTRVSQRSLEQTHQTTPPPLTLPSATQTSPEAKRGEYNVMVPRTQSRDAAALVAKFLRVPQGHAEKLLKKPAIFVAREVDKEYAMHVAKTFKASGVTVRVTRKKT